MSYYQLRCVDLNRVTYFNLTYIFVIRFCIVYQFSPGTSIRNIQKMQYEIYPSMSYSGTLHLQAPIPEGKGSFYPPTPHCWGSDKGIFSPIQLLTQNVKPVIWCKSSNYTEPRQGHVRVIFVSSVLDKELVSAT